MSDPTGQKRKEAMAPLLADHITHIQGMLRESLNKKLSVGVKSDSEKSDQEAKHTSTRTKANMTGRLSLLRSCSPHLHSVLRSFAHGIHDYLRSPLGEGVRRDYS